MISKYFLQKLEYLNCITIQVLDQITKAVYVLFSIKCAVIRKRYEPPRKKNNLGSNHV